MQNSLTTNDFLTILRNEKCSILASVLEKSKFLKSIIAKGLSVLIPTDFIMNFVIKKLGIDLATLTNSSVFEDILKNHILLSVTDFETEDNEPFISLNANEFVYDPVDNTIDGVKIKKKITLPHNAFIFIINGFITTDEQREKLESLSQKHITKPTTNPTPTPKTTKLSVARSPPIKTPKLEVLDTSTKLASQLPVHTHTQLQMNGNVLPSLAQIKANLKEVRHNFITENSEISDKQKKWCRCIIEVQAKGKVNSPYAICSKSVGTSYRYCSVNYDWYAMEYEQLIAWCQLHKVESKGLKTREELIRAILQYKIDKGYD